MSASCCGGACETPAPPPRLRWWTTNRVLGLAGLFIALGAVAAYVEASLASVLAYAAAILLQVPTPARRAWQSVRRRTLDINVLMLIAVAGAIALGDWLEAASVVWLFGIAQWLEVRSMDRARHAIRAVLDLAPTTAIVRRSGLEREMAASAIVPGDLVVVRPGERFAVDGVIRAGASTVDQAPVTGESLPTEKEVGDTVFAGTINGMGALEVEASQPASDSVFARIVHLVEQAQTRRAPIQTFVDRFARRYTPAVVVLAIAVAVLPPLFVGGAGGWHAAFATWSYRALALLVVACPCALVISTPVSIVSALTAAARHGVLIKGGIHLEQLSAVRCMAFDKTGTLTEGRVAVTDIISVDGSSAANVLAVAASLESRSEHPIGRAIVSRAKVDGIHVLPGVNFTALPGLGAEATVGSESAVIGSHRLFEGRNLCTPVLHARVEEIEDRGGMPVLVSQGGAALGVLGLADQVRENGRRAVTSLREEGIDRLVLLTGDRGAAANAVGLGVGLDETHGDLLPHQKVDQVLRLRAAHGPVAMVGDGVNDAPALAAADVGIAMGVAGTHVALETADVALMADDLTKLPYAVRLGRATLGNIHANVAIALGLKLVFVGLAVSGLATLWMAVLADTGASLVVTANSLRLLRVR